MQLLTFIPLAGEYLEAVARAWPGAGIRQAEDEAGVDPAAVNVILTFRRRFSPEFLAKAVNLEWVHCTAAGVELLLTPEFKAHRCLLTNARGVYNLPMVEHVLLLMLAFARRLPELMAAQREARWLPQVRAEELRGKTVLVAGLGGVGLAVARKCRSLGMRVIGTRRSGQPVPGMSTVLTPEGLGQLLPEADYVLVAAPATAETRRLIGEAELKLMQPSAVLINVARGSLVDQAALAAALKEGRLRGAGLDVFETEPLPADSPLWSLGNVIISPHCSASSPENKRRNIELFVKNLRRWRKGEPLLNSVDKGRGY